jgi:hypothetical protein
MHFRYHFQRNCCLQARIRGRQHFCVAQFFPDGLWQKSQAQLRRWVETGFQSHSEFTKLRAGRSVKSFTSVVYQLIAAKLLHLPLLEFCERDGSDGYLDVSAIKWQMHGVSKPQHFYSWDWF